MSEKMDIANIKMFGSDDKVAEGVRSLEVGETACFPNSKLLAARNAASTQGIQLNRKYRSCFDREKGIVMVKRLQ